MIRARRAALGNRSRLIRCFHIASCQVESDRTTDVSTWRSHAFHTSKWPILHRPISACSPSRDCLDLPLPVRQKALRKKHATLHEIGVRSDPDLAREAPQKLERLTPDSVANSGQRDMALWSRVNAFNSTLQSGPLEHEENLLRSMMWCCLQQHQILPKSRRRTSRPHGLVVYNRGYKGFAKGRLLVHAELLTDTRGRM